MKKREENNKNKHSNYDNNYIQVTYNNATYINSHNKTHPHMTINTNNSLLSNNNNT